MKVRLQNFSFILVLILTGCLGLSSERYLQNKYTFMVDQGDPKAYAEGYVDGCAVGRRLAGDKRFEYRKNGLRFEKDALYAKGWQDGQINCRNEVLAEGMGIKPGTSSTKQALESQDPAQHQVADEMREIWEELKK